MGVHVVEPLYPSYATQWLQGGSVLELGATRHDQGWSDNDEAERAKLALSLHETADLGESWSRSRSNYSQCTVLT